MVLQNLIFVLPEIIITVFASLVLMLELFCSKNKYISYLFAQVGLLLAALATLVIVGSGKIILFNGSYIIDNFCNIAKLLFYFITSIIFVYSIRYLQVRKAFTGEFFALSMFSMLGMIILVSSSSFLTLYLGIELFALPLYALIAFVKEQKLGFEAAMKYFVLGGLASGLFLYGVSLIYGVTGDYNLIALYAKLSTIDYSGSMVLSFGIMFILTGLAFKLGAAPFHMWVPDTYHGSSTPVTLLISTTAKIAGFGMAIRLLIDAFPMISNIWQPILIIMAVLSLAIGNIAAIVQSNIKRLLAYSTISHIGFVLLALLNAPQIGFVSGMFYVIIYSLTTMAAFGVIVILSKKGFEADNLEDFKGLGKTNPWIAFLMLLVMFSLAGVPPLAGFYAKFLVLRDLLDSGFIILAILALVFSVVAAFYYLKVVKYMFFDNPATVKSQIIDYSDSMNFSGRAMLSLNGLALLFLGIFPTPILYLSVLATI